MEDTTCPSNPRAWKFRNETDTNEPQIKKAKPPKTNLLVQQFNRELKLSFQPHTIKLEMYPKFPTKNNTHTTYN